MMELKDKIDILTEVMLFISIALFIASLGLGYYIIFTITPHPSLISFESAGRLVIALSPIAFSMWLFDKIMSITG